MFKIFRSLIDGSPDRKTINSLIETSFKIAVHYTKVNSVKISKQLNTEVETIRDVAIEAITPLFTYDEDNELRVIKTYKKWSSKITDEESALYFLNKVIARRVFQHITYVLKKSDPFFAKILDSVNYLVKKGGYKKQSYLGAIYITENRITYKTIDHIIFNELPYTLFLDKDTMIKNILKYIKSETEYYPAIPLNLLVRRLENIHLNEFENVNTRSNFIFDYDLKEIVNAGLNEALIKLKNSYGKNKKLTSKELIIFEKTLNEIAFDIKDGGLKPGLFDYLKSNMQILNKESFHSRYQNILEYLLKIMKKKIAEELKK